MSEKPTGPESEEQNPFSPENIGVVHFIMQARIYDALMAVLAHLNPEVSDKLLEAHLRGDLVGPEPRFSGMFVADATNDAVNE